MPVQSYVVAFPSAFSRRHITALARNIRRILRVQNEPYASVRRDGDIILVDAHDPVFASAAVGLLFGVDRTLIARRVENDFEQVAAAISEVGGNLLLAGDRFLVRVEGHTRGFLPRDVEMAATSSIIEARAPAGARPGTAENHDKLLYAYLTRRGAYVSIFADRCLGGLPLGVQGRAVCCVFDTISALTCLETMRMGFETEVVLCYAAESQRMPLAKMLDRIIPRMAQKRVKVAAVQMTPGGRDYLETAALATEIMLGEAAERGIRHISLPVSRMLFAGEAADRLAARVHGAGMVPVMPLPGDGRLFEMLGELNMAGSRAVHSTIHKRQGVPAVPADLRSHTVRRSEFAVRTGPNNLHDILDSDW